MTTHKSREEARRTARREWEIRRNERLKASPELRAAANERKRLLRAARTARKAPVMPKGITVMPKGIDVQLHRQHGPWAALFAMQGKR